MTDKVVSSSPDLKQTLKMREIEIQSLINENVKIQKYYDDSVNQVNSLYTCMVNKYHQMKAEHKDCEKKLRLINSENARFQYITQCLEKTVEELTEKSLEKSHFADDDALLLEECGEKLTKELCEHRRRFKEISTQLDGVREKLAKSEESGVYLKKCADYMEESENRGRARRDRVESEWRSMVDQLSVELEESKRVEERLRAALSVQADEARLSEQSTVTDKEKMRAEIERITADLTSEAKCNQRLDRYSETDAQISRDGSVYYSMGLNRCLESRYRDRDNQWRRQNDDQNSDKLSVNDRKSDSSFFVDAIACGQKSIEDRKPSSRSIADHSAVSDHVELNQSVRSTSSYPSWSDAQLALKYTVSKPLNEETDSVDRKSSSPFADDVTYDQKPGLPSADDVTYDGKPRCRSTVDVTTGSDSVNERLQSVLAPDWQMVQLIRKYESVKQPTVDDDAAGDDEPAAQSSSSVSD